MYFKLLEVKTFCPKHVTESTYFENISNTYDVLQNVNYLLAFIWANSRMNTLVVKKHCWTTRILFSTVGTGAINWIIGAFHVEITFFWFLEKGIYILKKNMCEFGSNRYLGI